MLFKCDWVDNRVQNKWVKTDQFGTTTMNFRHLFNTGEKISDEPFILASQAVQVYYVPEAIDTDWVAAVQSVQRDVFDFDNLEDEDIINDNGPVVYLPNLNRDVTVDIVNGVVPSIRTDIDANFLSVQRAAALSASVAALSAQRAPALSEQHANFLTAQRAAALSVWRARALSVQPATASFA